MPAPLSYCFASFHPGDYDLYPEPVGHLSALGFRWVTFVPTFAVREPFEIGLDYTPPQATIRAALLHALALGFDVKLEPHLDWRATLDAVGEWRGFMRFNPLGAYLETVILPLLDLAVEAHAVYPERRVSLTLGSEVDRSLREFPLAWLRLRERVKLEGVTMGHKLNHDAGPSLFSSEYLAGLDFVSFSFYPPVKRPAHFYRHARKLQRKLPRGPGFQIGEFGLGGRDTTRPYLVDHSFFDNMEEDGRELRRTYYSEFLRCLEQLPQVELATFWSAGPFDFLGAFNSRYKDEKLIRLVEDYNR